MNKKKLIFITGTRADFGKLKPLISKVSQSQLFEVYLFVTGMHTLTKYGNTVDEVYKSFPELRMEDGFRNIYVYRNQNYGEPMEQILANTIQGFSRYVSELKPDLIVIHGDRIEAMAGAMVGAIRNILVAHVEGGEVSGTIDELIRHSTSKMSHIHFVSHDAAKTRLKQLGESDQSIFTIGSPDIDLMLSKDLPLIDEVKKYYNISFGSYSIVIFHPVTTDLSGTKKDVHQLVEALKLQNSENFVIIYPNNDEGSQLIFDAYQELDGLKNILLLPSMRVEYFLTLLKSAKLIIGNSSAGIIEAPVYGVPTINISKRQNKRLRAPSVIDISGTKEEILNLMNDENFNTHRHQPNFSFGDGKSAARFLEALVSKNLWEIPTQKEFNDLG